MFTEWADVAKYYCIWFDTVGANLVNKWVFFVQVLNEPERFFLFSYELLILDEFCCFGEILQLVKHFVVAAQNALDISFFILRNESMIKYESHMRSSD